MMHLTEFHQAPRTVLFPLSFILTFIFSFFLLLARSLCFSQHSHISFQTMTLSLPSYSPTSVLHHLIDPSSVQWTYSDQARIFRIRVP